MPNFFGECSHLTQDVDIQAAILAPLLLRHEWPFDENSFSIPTIPLLLISLLGLCLFVFFAVLEVRMELVNPLLVDAKEHK